jgi:hypothetical protein
MSASTRDRMSLTSSGSPTAPEPSARRPWRYGAPLPRAAKIPRAAYPLAHEVGCQPKTAAHYLAKIGHLAAAVIHSYQRSGDQVGLARFLAQIETAKAGARAVPLTDALERESVQCAHEHVETIFGYAVDPNPVTKRALLRSIDHECGQLLLFRSAVLHEGEATP